MCTVVLEAAVFNSKCMHYTYTCVCEVNKTACCLHFRVEVLLNWIWCMNIRDTVLMDGRYCLLTFGSEHQSCLGILNIRTHNFCAGED